MDGIYSGLRAETQRLYVLVMIGMNVHGEKHLLAMEDGMRVSTQSWREVLLNLKARGLIDPALALGMVHLDFGRRWKQSFPAHATNVVSVIRRRMS